MEEMETTTTMGTGLGVLLFAAGALIGAGVALLYTPRTGREFREKVSGMTGDAVTKFKDLKTGAEEKIRSSLSKGKEMAEEKAASYSEGGQTSEESMFH